MKKLFPDDFRVLFDWCTWLLTEDSVCIGLGAPDHEAVVAIGIIRIVGHWTTVSLCRCLRKKKKKKTNTFLSPQGNLQEVETDRTQENYSILRDQCYKWYIGNEADAGELYRFIQSIVSIPDQDKIDESVALYAGDMQRWVWQTMSGRKFSRTLISDFLWPFSFESGFNCVSSRGKKFVSSHNEWLTLYRNIPCFTRKQDLITFTLKQIASVLRLWTNTLFHCG